MRNLEPKAEQGTDQEVQAVFLFNQDLLGYTSNFLSKPGMEARSFWLLFKN